MLKNIEINSFYSLDLFLLLLKTWKMTTDWLLNEVAMITETNLDWMKKRYRLYSENQLNWKPNKDTWSLNEIFAHLNEYANFYHSVIFKRLETTKYRTPSATFSSSPLGKSAWGSMKLGNAKNIKRKFNAPKLYNPSINKQLVSGNDCQTFEEKQREFLSLLEQVTTVNLRKVRVPIAISKFVRLRLGDALLFVAYHNERHMQQAMNISKLPAFPKK